MAAMIVVAITMALGVAEVMVMMAMMMAVMMMMMAVIVSGPRSVEDLFQQIAAWQREAT